MAAFKANLINVMVLIVMSVWGYLAAETTSLTALIPAAFALFLLLCAPGVKSENKLISHIAVLLTLLLLIALFMPLSSAIARGDLMAMLRVGLMLLTAGVAQFCECM